MSTFIMLSTLTDEGAKTIKENPNRIKEVNQEIEALGVRVLYQYATLGQYDFLNIVEAPDIPTIARVSAELSSRGSIRLQTLPAIPIVLTTAAWSSSISATARDSCSSSSTRSVRLAPRSLRRRFGTSSSSE